MFKKRATELLQGVIISELYNIPGNPKGEYIEDRITQLSFSALGQNAPIEEKRLSDIKNTIIMVGEPLIKQKLIELTQLIRAVGFSDRSNTANEL